MPQNLPDDVLMSCSLQYQGYREQNENTTISLLLLSVLILKSDADFIIDESYKITLSKEELEDYIELYGIMILLEEMRRIEIISIKPRDLPSVKNIFNQSRKIKLDILNKELFENMYNT